MPPYTQVRCTSESSVSESVHTTMHAHNLNQQILAHPGSDMFARIVPRRGGLQPTGAEWFQIKFKAKLRFDFEPFRAVPMKPIPPRLGTILPNTHAQMYTQLDRVRPQNSQRPASPRFKRLHAPQTHLLRANMPVSTQRSHNWRRSLVFSADASLACCSALALIVL